MGRTGGDFFFVSFILCQLLKSKNDVVEVFGTKMVNRLMLLLINHHVRSHEKFRNSS